jgi:hypothetical protein
MQTLCSPEMMIALAKQMLHSSDTVYRTTRHIFISRVVRCGQIDKLGNQYVYFWNLLLANGQKSAEPPT